MDDPIKVFLIIAALGIGLLISVGSNSISTPTPADSIEDLYELSLAPFYHGVASGDPAPDGFVIWTRVTPEFPSLIDVSWSIAHDKLMTDLVAEGTANTSLERDYTVKIEITGLEPGSTYYYQFGALGAESTIGRTKTTPVGPVEQLKFAVISCSNLLWGHFSAYEHIANREDLDAVIHLGDYIYEYGASGPYGHPEFLNQQPLFPPGETITLEDYRARYATYRLDPHLRKAHQTHPFIVVWDDHEFANDAWVSGAENHDPSEGDWGARVAAAKQAYAEWMPIRGDAQQIYRVIEYGDLLDLVMLDTRIEGRDELLTDVNHPNLQKANRSILGAEQKQWFKDELTDSGAIWKVIGNQVIFSDFNSGWAAPIQGVSADEIESLFLDIWDGFPAERLELIEFFHEQQLENLIWVTGDFHTSLAFEVSAEGSETLGVEFTTPSLTSANLNEHVGDFKGRLAEFFTKNQALFGNPNPHLKYADLDRHGYLLLTLNNEEARTDYYYLNNVLKKNSGEHWGAGLVVKRGSSELKRVKAALK
jgi:alkaline phosphatase D